MTCPGCGADISDSYQDDEPDVGVIGGWYCEKCDITIPIEADYSEDDYL